MRLGAEFQVNLYTPVFQALPAVAADADGDFVVTWSSLYQDGAGYGVFARRFNGVGAAQAGEFRVNLRTTGSQAAPSVALDPDGDFVVAWQSEQDGSGYGVFARRFSSAGAAQATEFQVNSATQNSQRYPALATTANGSFVVTWQIDFDGSLLGVGARRFDSSGTALGTEVQVNTFTTGNQFNPAIAASSGGDFVIAWESNGQDGSNNGIFARRFDVAGTPQASEFQVNSFTPSYQRSPSVAVDGTNAFVIAWRSFGQDGSLYGVFARRFDSAGVAQASELQVNTYTVDHQSLPSVAAEDNGHFLIAWESVGQDSIVARRFDAAGVPQASEFQVNTYITGTQLTVAATASRGGKYIVAWDSIGQDGDSHGIFAQRFGKLAPLDIDGDGATDALTDGILLLRFFFGFTGNTLTTGAVGAACTRCTAAAIEPYLGTAGQKQVTRLGGEFQVNLYTPTGQRYPAVAADGDGDFVVAWTSAGQESFHEDVIARRFDAAGVGQGGEFLVNSYTSDYQISPSVGMDGNGDFAIAWNGVADLGPRNEIFARRFDAAGMAQAGDFQVNIYTTATQYRPSVAVDASGDFVIAWGSIGQDGSGGGIFARRFNASGTAQGVEFQVSAVTANAFQRSPAVAMDDDGDFVVAAWAGYPNYVIFARRFNSSGTSQGAELQVHESTVFNQASPAVAMDADGDFVIAWHSYGPGGSPYDVLARRFNAAGAKQGAELLINAYTPGAQSGAKVGMTAVGDFVVVWQSFGQEGSGAGVFGRSFNSLGVARGAEFQVNSYTLNYQYGQRWRSATAAASSWRGRARTRTALRAVSSRSASPASPCSTSTGTERSVP